MRPTHRIHGIDGARFQPTTAKITVITKTAKVLTITSLIVKRAPPAAVTCWKVASTPASPPPVAAA